MMWVIPAWLALASAATMPHLDNGMMRVELDPATLSVKFVGVPGGRNLVEPATQREAIPGGLFSDVYLDGEAIEGLRRAPATIVAHSRHSITLVSPVDDVSGLQVKLVLTLHARRGEAEYAFTVLSHRSEPVSIRIETRGIVPAGATAGGEGELPFAEGVLSPLAFEEGWQITTPPAPLPKAPISARGNAQPVRVSGPGGLWRREADSAASCAFEFVPRIAQSSIVLGTESHEVSASEPVQYRERWRFTPAKPPHE